MKPTRRRRWKLLLAIPVVLFVLLVLAAWPGSSTFTVSPETTYITGPLDKDGYVDYVTALNERLRGDITPEQNANVLLFRALGPHPEGATMPPGYFEWLGVWLPEQGEYLVGFDVILKERLLEEYSHRKIVYYEQQMRACKWPWSATDESELAEWIKRNEKPLEVVREGVRLPEYYNPFVPKTPGLMNSLIPNVQKCREIAALLTCRAMLRVQEAKYDEAWQDLLTCHRLGRLVARGGSLIECLVGIAIDLVATNADIAFMHQAKANSQRLAIWMADLSKLPAIPQPADKIDVCERLIALEMMMLIPQYGTEYLESSGRTPVRKDRFADRLFSRSINWDRAMRDVNRWYDRYAAAARLSDPVFYRQEMAQLTSELKALKEDAAVAMILGQFYGPKKRGEAIGNIIVGLMLPAIEKVVSSRFRAEQVQINLHLAFALAAYRADNGRYPAKLDELAPKYLPAVHDDIFSGKPLIYQPNENGYLLYSVGQDGQDNDGRSFDDVPRGDDLPVRMPVPPPKPREPNP